MEHSTEHARLNGIVLLYVSSNLHRRSKHLYLQPLLNAIIGDSPDHDDDARGARVDDRELCRRTLFGHCILTAICSSNKNRERTVVY